MSKLTKRAYDAEKQRIADALLDVQLLLDWWQAEYDAGALTITPDMTDEWNALEDRRWELEQEHESLDGDWRTRNWTAADWNSYALVAANID